MIDLERGFAAMVARDGSSCELARREAVGQVHAVSKAIVNVHAAKSQFSKLLERAEAGEEIIIARGGKPVARLVALRGAKRAARQPGLLKGRVQIADDFDAPLSNEELAAFVSSPIEPPRRR